MGINWSSNESSSHVSTHVKLNDLNEDVFFSIFSYFSLEELLVLSEVCVRWKALVNRLLNGTKCLHFTPVIGLPFEECCERCHTFRDYNKQTLIVNNRIDCYKPFISRVMSQCLNVKSITLVALDFNDNCSPFGLLLDYCDSDVNHLNLVHLHNKRNFRDKRY